MGELNAGDAVVAQLLSICCEDKDIKAMRLAFERILGKPEKVVVIKRCRTRVLYPDATGRLSEGNSSGGPVAETALSIVAQDDVVIDGHESPGVYLRELLVKVCDMKQADVFAVLEDRDSYDVATVLVCNLYAVAILGANLGAIEILFDYLDGSVADVIRIETDSVIELEDYSDKAPYNAVKNSDGVWCVESETAQ